MDNQSNASLLQSLQTKQKLIKLYYDKLSEKEKERRELNGSIKRLRGRLAELIYSDPDPAQLMLFENIDEFLKSPEEELDDLS